MSDKLSESEWRILELNKRLTVMYNRCLALSHGDICMFCDFKNDCSARKSFLEYNKSEGGNPNE